jgi:triacylglycerol lipase
MSSASDRMDTIMRFLDERPDTDWDWLFDDSATESPTNALALGNLALLAYSGEHDIESYLTKWGFDGGFRFLSADDTAVFVTRRSDSVFISCRGTEPTMIAEWASDITYQQAGLPGFAGKVHGGFGRAFSSVRDQTAQALADFPAARHYFTGHSLGGAIAVLAAATFSDRATVVYTYGQPRVGDQTFSDAYDSVLGDVTFRYVNNYDIVPHVPPKRLPAPLPTPGGPLDLRQVFANVVAAVTNLVTGELFAHVGLLRLFIDGQPISDNVSDFDARDPFDLKTTLDPVIALRSIRERINLALNGERDLLDHDPKNGYLPRLRQQTKAAKL